MGFISVLASNIIPSVVVSSLNPDFQWHLMEIGAEEAWNYTRGNHEITVAVIDSGIDFSHHDLSNQSWVNSGEIENNGIDDDGNGYVDDINGWDFRDNDNNPSPGHHHGTFVAGLIAADDDNNLSVGIAPNIKLMDLRFLDNNNAFGGGDWGMFADAVDYARENGAQIIHLSIQAYGIPPNSFYTAIKRAYDSGVVIVSVTGNNEDQVTYPGNYSEVIAVSAITKDREIAFFSSPGDQNEICAPGEDVYSILPGNNEFVKSSGTSYAAPLVSGTIALILSLNSGLTLTEIRSVLHETCIDLGDVGKDPIFGYGLINASAALEKVFIEYNNGTSVTTTSTSGETTDKSDNSEFEFMYFSLTVLLFIFSIVIIGFMLNFGSKSK